MSSYKRQTLSLFAIASFLIIIPSILVSAESPKKPTGITISPAYQLIAVLDSDAQQLVTLKVTNNEYFPQTLQLKTADFNSLNDSGGLLFVGTNPSQLQKDYGLANWLTLPQKTVTIPAKQTSNVKLFIQNRSDLAPGGHYGALMLYISNGTKSQGTNQVGVYPVATALMFVTKLNGATYKLSLNRVNASHSFFKLPSSVSLRFYDDGNTQLTPRGYITITDPRGKLISKGIINEDSLLILPQNYRYYSVPLKQTALTSRPGNYKMTVNFNFDGYNKYRTYQSSYYLGAPEVLIALVLLSILTIGIVIFYLRYWHHHKPKKQILKSNPKAAKKIKVEIE